MLTKPFQSWIIGRTHDCAQPMTHHRNSACNPACSQHLASLGHVPPVGLSVTFRSAERRFGLCGLMLALMLPVAYRAQAADPFFDEVPLVLTASRLEQSALDAPAAVTVIDREMIEASGFTELHDLLRLVPGFLVANWPDGSPTVVNHGLGDAHDRRIKVMIDGRTVNSVLWGDTRWQDLPIRVDDLDRVEVVRGPNGAAYGVNAFQGVINLITRPPATEDGVTLIGRVGRNGFFDTGVRINNPVGTAVDWRLTASRRAALNFESHFEPGMGYHSREHIARNVVNFNASTWLGPQDELRLQLGASDGVNRRGTPGKESFPPHNESDRSLYLHMGWVRALDVDSEFSMQYYHQQERVRAGFPVPMVDAATGTRLMVPTDTDRDARRDDLEVQFNDRLSDNLRMMIGAGVRQESVESLRYFNRTDPVRATHWQMFGSLTWNPIERLSIDAGGTWEKHQYSGTLFSPRLAALYAISPEQSLRAAVGTSYRAPSMMESESFEVIRMDGMVKSIMYRAMNPVEPERVRYVDLGYVAHARELGLRFDARVFRESYSRYLDDNSCINPPNLGTFPTHAVCTGVPDNFVPFRPEQKSFIFSNLDAFVMNGAEFSIDWRHRGWGRVILSQAFIDIDPRGRVFDGDIQKSAPSAMTSLLLIKNLPNRWRASLGYYHNQEMYWLNGGDRVPARDRFDVRISRGFGHKSQENEIALQVHSVGGRYPEFHAGKFRAEPQAFVSLRYTF